MKNTTPLHLYEEIMLLCLRDEEGTISAGYPDQLLAGAIIAELVLEAHITVDDTRRQLVNVKNHRKTGDTIIDECLAKMKAAKRRASLQTWITRFAGIKELRHRVARQLCDRKILAASEDKVLFLFKRRIYPEINPGPEKEIIERMHRAIFGSDRNVDPRTTVLISIAYSSELLNQTFGRKTLKPQKKRLKQIANGDLAGKATKQVIDACQAAVIVACVIPTVVVTTASG